MTTPTNPEQPTPTTGFQEELRDVLLDVASYYAQHDGMQRELSDGKSIYQALAAITALINERVIGEDEPLPDVKEKPLEKMHLALATFERNMLRYEQRRIVGGGDE